MPGTHFAGDVGSPTFEHFLRSDTDFALFEDDPDRCAPAPGFTLPFTQPSESPLVSDPFFGADGFSSQLNDPLFSEELFADVQFDSSAA